MGIYAVLIERQDEATLRGLQEKIAVFDALVNALKRVQLAHIILRQQCINLFGP